ncbi:MAG: hypothetical protein C0507_00395 [Cyanobacteria bacterium PR.3.49]|nr:hypothetical protein [Cyanobacteria bacterium PR.3.49]
MIIAILAGMSMFIVYCMLVDLVDKHLAYGGAKHVLVRIALTTLILIVVAEVFGNFGLLGFFTVAVIDIILLVRKHLTQKARQSDDS